MRNLTHAEIGTAFDEVDSVQADAGEIAVLAYQLWTSRGCPIGSPEEDWFRAEEMVRARRNLIAVAAGS